MAPRVYIDGHIGTTGLRIRDWMAERRDVELLRVPEARRKDDAARREAVEAADIAVLCLPDEASRQAVGWARGADTRVIDSSTAYRVDGSFVYGLPELAPGQRDAIRQARFVANPGCYPTGFVLLVRPLVDAGLLPPETPLTIHALSGYSGGGRKLIERWESEEAGLGGLAFEAPYALDRVHKHIPEMVEFARIRHAPQFVPAVGPFRCGMRVQVPLHAEQLAGGVSGKTVWETLHRRYAGETFIDVVPIQEPLGSDERRFDPRAMNDTNRVALHVVPHPSGHVLLMAILDNLGKGACGGAIQSLNLMLGFEEGQGLPR